MDLHQRNILYLQEVHYGPIVPITKCTAVGLLMPQYQCMAFSTNLEQTCSLTRGKESAGLVSKQLGSPGDSQQEN